MGVMISFDVFKAAVCEYLEANLVQRTPQNRRILAGGFVMLVVPLFLKKKVKALHPYLVELELMDGEGMVNVDRLEELGVDLVRRYGSFQMKVLDVGVSIGEDDVRKLATLCRSAQV